MRTDVYIFNSMFGGKHELHVIPPPGLNMEHAVAAVVRGKEKAGEDALAVETRKYVIEELEAKGFTILTPTFSYECCDG